MRWINCCYLGLVLLATWFVQEVPARASTFVRISVASNILVSDGSVIFLQGTGSLTVLDLEKGDVLLRKGLAGWGFANDTLVQTPHGVLLMDYDRIVLLDSHTFDTVWQAKGCYDAVTDGEYVCSHNGNSTVSCRSLRTGDVRWNAEVEEGWKLVAVGGKVVVSTRRSQAPVALQVLDLDSGKKVLDLKRSPDAGVLQVHFDGERIYVLYQRHGAAQYDSQPGELIAYDLNGNVVTQIPYKSPEVTPNVEARWGDAFFWGDRYFGEHGEIRPATVFERECVAKFDEERGRSLRLVPSGVLECIQPDDFGVAPEAVLHMMMPDGSWKAYAPYLGDGGPNPVCEAQGKLLLGSVQGYLECLDLKTGRPVWLYAFPVIDQLASYSSPHGLPPYVTQQAAAYRRGISRLHEISGNVPLAQDFATAPVDWDKLPKTANYSGRVIIDPSPDDPYGDLWQPVSWAAACALLPVVVASFFMLVGRFRRNVQEGVQRRTRYLLHGVLSLALSVSPAVGLILFGRLSLGWTLTLKVVFLVAILCAVNAIFRMYGERRWIVASLVVVFLIGWVWFVAYPLWYA
jgi:outer membrane protein assembly factor BamB